jgi:hypothetical protein
MAINFSDASMTSIPGVYAKPGVELNNRMRGFLAALRLKVGFPIVVTSGIRSTQAQASAMRAKVADPTGRGDGELSIYNGALASEVIKGGTGSTAAIKATLDAQVARDVFMSRHMRGDALDLRTSGMDSGDLAALQAAVKALGANKLLEATPPHLHIEDIPAQFMAASPVVLGGTAAVLGFLYWGLSD